MAFYEQSYTAWAGSSRASPFDNRPSSFPTSSIFRVAVLTHQDLPKPDEHHAFNHQLEGILISLYSTTNVTRG